MGVRSFEVGEICIHRGSICRVEASERCIIGVTCPSAYSLKDGTEVNPTLTLVPLYGPDGEPVRCHLSRTAVSGNVEYAQDALGDMRHQVALLQKKIALLEGLAPPEETE